jgi:glycosyltransferase involved in cell wall biosynthesis
MKNLNNQIKVCQVVDSINQNVGGPANSVTNLAQYLSKNDINSQIFTINYQDLGNQLTTFNVKIHSYPGTKLTKYLNGFQPRASHALNQLAKNELDIVHNHGLWLFSNIYARKAAVKNNVPFLISTRGMLESWSLKNNWFKKIPAWLLYEWKNLDSVSVFHATSEEEVRSIRRLNFRQPIALIPNGVVLPEFKNIPSQEILINSFPEIRDKKWLLFLSRVHPKKGVDNLIHVWKNLVKQFPDWHLIIAGPSQNTYQTKLEKLTNEFNLQEHITFTGMLTDEIKASALGNAQLFVLPSHSENFGIAIAESLAYMVPVITTWETPWKDLELYNCGWWIRNNNHALMYALKTAMELSDKERREMGIRGRYLVETKYSWDTVAQEMSNVYRWILNNDAPPDCLRFNEI